MIGIKTNAKQIAKLFFKQKEAFLKHFSNAFGHVGSSFYSKLYKERLKGPPGIQSRGKRGIGRYFKKKVDLPKDNALDMGVTIYSTSKVSKVHEFGGKYSSKDGGYVHIPLSAKRNMFTAKGFLKKKFKDIKKLKNKAVITSKKGEKYLVIFSGKKRKIKKNTPVFAMRKSFKVKPRLGFYHTWDSHEERILNILSKACKQAIKGNWKQGKVA